MTPASSDTRPQSQKPARAAGSQLPSRSSLDVYANDERHASSTHFASDGASQRPLICGHTTDGGFQCNQCSAAGGILSTPVTTVSCAAGNARRAGNPTQTVSTCDAGGPARHNDVERRLSAGRSPGVAGIPQLDQPSGAYDPPYEADQITRPHSELGNSKAHANASTTAQLPTAIPAHSPVNDLQSAVDPAPQAADGPTADLASNAPSSSHKKCPRTEHDVAHADVAANAALARRQAWQLRGRRGKGSQLAASASAQLASSANAQLVTSTKAQLTPSASAWFAPPSSATASRRTDEPFSGAQCGSGGGREVRALSNTEVQDRRLPQHTLDEERRASAFILPRDAHVNGGYTFGDLTGDVPRHTSSAAPQARQESRRSPPYSASPGERGVTIPRREKQDKATQTSCRAKRPRVQGADIRSRDSCAARHTTVDDAERSYVESATTSPSPSPTEVSRALQEVQELVRSIVNRGAGPSEGFASAEAILRSVSSIARLLTKRSEIPPALITSSAAREDAGAFNATLDAISMTCSDLVRDMRADMAAICGDRAICLNQAHRNLKDHRHAMRRVVFKLASHALRQFADEGDRTNVQYAREKHAYKEQAEKAREERAKLRSLSNYYFTAAEDARAGRLRLQNRKVL
ncbi:hypothetical protein BD626DRAFT_508 [Schizophyllum amplum]|uniref:Uncharacterized protein n=1 Tax=Schizophyllum amplum TaxID=97359 RepID=A0A550CVI3_9AGAR|nr:hypothetical protein BD626DRAFT_508 [Auriculariopsis ampla]